MKTGDENSTESQNDAEGDSILQKELLALKTKILSSNSNDRTFALESLSSKILSASKSMTSIPKPLKLLSPFFEDLRTFFEAKKGDPSLSPLADILSCMAMICPDENKLYCLRYKLESQNDRIDLWGEEYIRHLSRELCMEFERSEDTLAIGSKQKNLILKIVDSNLANSSEVEAVDLLLEVDLLSELPKRADKESAARMASYLLKCIQYIPSEMDQFKTVTATAFDLCRIAERPSEALKAALIAGDVPLVKASIELCRSEQERRQLGLSLGSLLSGASETIAEGTQAENEDGFASAAGRESLSRWFGWLAKELSVEDPKRVEGVYKSHLIDRSTFGKYGVTSRSSPEPADSARENLASTFVNAFVHAGFGNDALLSAENSDWVFKNKGDGMISATASLGLIHLWGLENGFQAVDRYTESASAQVKAGALLGFGLVGCGVCSELDASTAMLIDPLEGDDVCLKKFAAIGLAICSAASHDEDLLAPLDRAAADRLDVETSAFVCLCLGLVFQGTCRDEAVETILDSLVHYSAEEAIAADSFLLMASGLAFVFLGTNEKSEGICEAVEILGRPRARVVRSLIRAFAYAGSNNVIHFHETLKEIKSAWPSGEAEAEQNTEKGENGDQSDETKTREKFQSNEETETVAAISVLGLALISMGEKLGKNMAYRILDDLLRYENTNIRKIVPLALGLMFVSTPDYSVLQVLSKLSHDPDSDISTNAIFALGLVSAGTNNSRVAKTLRNLAVYYQKDEDHLFITRISQGLVHCGKGLLTLNPYHLDGAVLNKKSLSGLLVVLLSCFDMRKGLLGSKHYLLYFLSLALRPRMLLTVDEKGEALRVAVRVGQAVDDVRLAGESKAISGFQTHNTPVLLAAGEKAELAGRKYIALSNYLEGIVILKRNLDFEGGEDAMEDEG